MVMLATGVLLWAALHLIPAVARGFRRNLVNRLGENGYKGVFSLAMLGAVALMVFGWRGAVPGSVYIPTQEMRLAALALVVAGFIFMAAANRASRLGRLVRHPQLTGVFLWAVGHLLANGDSRSLVLFGGLGAWAVVEIVLSSLFTPGSPASPRWPGN